MVTKLYIIGQLGCSYLNTPIIRLCLYRNHYDVNISIYSVECLGLLLTGVII